MTGSIPPAGPLAYEGQVVVPFISRTFSPQTTFNKFPVPTIWINTEAMEAYMLVAKPMGIADWILLGGVPGTLETITTPDAVVVVPSAANINFLNGMGVTITGSGSDITFNSIGGGLTWSTVDGTTQTMARGNGYFANNASGVTFTLPLNCDVGEVIAVIDINGGGWTIAQNTGQTIQIGKQSTTTGTGYLESTQIGDNIFLICTVANTNFFSISYVGDIIYV